MSEEYKVEHRPDGTNIHRFGDVSLTGMEQFERYENHKGIVVIGGDKGDVLADSVWHGEVDQDGESTVVLCDAEFRTSMEIDEADARAYLEEVVRFAYDSIQSEAFLAHER